MSSFNFFSLIEFSSFFLAFSWGCFSVFIGEIRWNYARLVENGKLVDLSRGSNFPIKAARCLARLKGGNTVRKCGKSSFCALLKFFTENTFSESKPERGNICRRFNTALKMLWIFFSEIFRPKLRWKVTFSIFIFQENLFSASSTHSNAIMARAHNWDSHSTAQQNSSCFVLLPKTFHQQLNHRKHNLPHFHSLSLYLSRANSIFGRCCFSKIIS